MTSRRIMAATCVVACLVAASLAPLAGRASWAAGIIAAPDITQKQPFDRATVDILFTSPALGGGSLTRYDIWVSDDNGRTWAGNTACAPVNGVVPAPCWSEGKKVDLLLAVPEASARIVKVRAVVDGDAGPWSAPLLVKTKGGRSMRVYVKTPDDIPVSGGSVTWKMVDGSVKSSQTYGLTADGYIDFPQVPAGEVQMTLTDGELPDGVLVSGQFSAVLGFKMNQLTIPRPPRAVRVVSVTMPNGLPVSGASVSVNSEDMTDVASLQGFTFKLPNSGLLSSVLDVHPVDPTPSPSPSPSASATPTPSASASPSPTDSGGGDTSGNDTSSYEEAMSDYEDTTYIGNYDYYYWDYDYYVIDWVVVDYFAWLKRYPVARHLRNSPANPGPVVASGTTNTMGRFVVKGFTTTIPSATVSYDDGVVSQTQTAQLNGALTNVELDYVPYLAATTTDFTSDTQSAVAVTVSVNGPASQGLARNGTTSAKGGVKVSVAQPKGATAKCKGIPSTFTTNAAGRATVKFCATVSGQYRLLSKTKGVLSMGALRVHARKTAPTRVLSLMGRSRKAGDLALTWKKPRDLGGAKTVSYLVTYMAGGRAKSVTVKSLATTLHKLKHATRYTITVQARTKYGLGAKATILVPVV